MSKVICANLSEYDNESIQVFFGEQATIAIPVALSYIKSGEVEIRHYTDNVIIPELNAYENNAQQYSLMSEESAQRSEFAKEETEDLVEEARLWAIGSIEERPEGSAKYWAEQFLEEATTIADEILGETSEPTEEPTEEPTVPDSLGGITGDKTDSEQEV